MTLKTIEIFKEMNYGASKTENIKIEKKNATEPSCALRQIDECLFILRRDHRFSSCLLWVWTLQRTPCVDKIHRRGV